MPTYAADVLPSAEGYNLGSASQPWQGYFTDSTDFAGVKLMISDGGSSPLGVLEAPLGSLLIVKSGSTATLWFKASGDNTNTGWETVTTNGAE